MKNIIQPILLLQFFLLVGIIGHSQISYEKQELLITMRDGVKLNTVIFTPKNATENVPFLFRAHHMESAGPPRPIKIVI
jgi:predicted acyl esterase